MTTDEKVERKLREAYEHIKNYMPNKDLTDMCKCCEAWSGAKMGGDGK